MYFSKFENSLRIIWKLFLPSIQYTQKLKINIPMLSMYPLIPLLYDFVYSFNIVRLNVRNSNGLVKKSVKNSFIFQFVFTNNDILKYDNFGEVYRDDRRLVTFVVAPLPMTVTFLLAECYVSYPLHIACSNHTRSHQSHWVTVVTWQHLA